MKKKLPSCPDEKTDWKEISLKMAQKLNFALTYLAPRGGGTGIIWNSKTGAQKHWKEDFADALELIPNLKVDREAMHAMGLPRKERERFFARRKQANEDAPAKKGAKKRASSLSA